MLRKQLALRYTQHISLELRATGTLYRALEHATDRVRTELLVDRLELSEGRAPEGPEWHSWEIDEETLAARLL